MSSDMKITEQDYIFETSDEDLLKAVEKFLSIQGNNFEYARHKKMAIDPESIAIYNDWVNYWYKLRTGKKLCLFELKDICGFNCTVQIVGDDADRRYLIKINPNMEEWM